MYYVYSKTSTGSCVLTEGDKNGVEPEFLVVYGVRYSGGLDSPPALVANREGGET